MPQGNELKLSQQLPTNLTWEALSKTPKNTP